MGNLLRRVGVWCVPDEALRWGWLMARLAYKASELVAGTAITGYMRRVGGFNPGGVISTAEAKRRANAVVERITPLSPRSAADILREYEDGFYFDARGRLRGRGEDA